MIIAPAHMRRSGAMARVRSMGRERSSITPDWAKRTAFMSAPSRRHRHPLTLGILIDVLHELARRRFHAVQHRLGINTHPDDAGENGNEQTKLTPVEVRQRLVRRLVEGV